VKLAVPARLRRKRPAILKARYDEHRVDTPLVQLLSDDDLKLLNELLPWHCFTVDAEGRPFGAAAWSGKRDTPQLIPDRRIELMDERFGLAGKHVLEIGCFEGVHTIALCDRAGSVTAIDGRVENVVKTIVRCAMFERRPTVFVCDLERPEPEQERRMRAELCHHMGVLYHLADPVTHLRQLGGWVSGGLMLDTHYATPDDAGDSYDVDGRTFACRAFGEARADPFSGMLAQSRWILLDDMLEVLGEAGFDAVDVVERRDERNGPRLLLFAEKTR
jgi:tRNA (mo5U34)-methyltransferase